MMLYVIVTRRNVTLTLHVTLTLTLCLPVFTTLQKSTGVHQNFRWLLKIITKNCWWLQPWQKFQVLTKCTGVYHSYLENISIWLQIFTSTNLQVLSRWLLQLLAHWLQVFAASKILQVLTKNTGGYYSWLAYTAWVQYLPVFISLQNLQVYLKISGG